MRSFLICSLGVALVGLISESAWATYSRVESMGKRADFFMDDVSIFDNPANMNIFPNFLIGEMGAFNQVKGAGSPALTTPTNSDPSNSWFGGIFSYSLGKHRDAPSLYPQISIGGAFNRRDEELFSLLPDSAEGAIVPASATNFDGFLGMTLSNGGMVGSHIYYAAQEGANLGDGSMPPEFGGDIRLLAFRGQLGINWPLARNVDGELSLGTAVVGYGPQAIDPELSFEVRGRAFSTLEIINGELVPLFSWSRWRTPGLSSDRYTLGIGTNVSLDRGFFWLGIEGMLNHTKSSWRMVDGKKSFYQIDGIQSEQLLQGVTIGFGIERNVWWDWMVLRVGGQKVMGYLEEDGPAANDKRSYIYTNPTGNMSSNDQIGFGIGLNVEEKLKVDATLAEDVLYTFGNLFSSPQHHIISRISATYSF